MQAINKDSIFSVFNINFRKLWQFSILLFTVCHVAFYYTSTPLAFLNPVSMYFFLFVSFVCILQKGYIKINYYLIPMLIFLPLLIFGLLYSKIYAYDIFYSFFVTVCIVFCFINYIENEKDAEYLFKAFMYGGILMVLYSLVLYGDGFIAAILDHTRVGSVVGNANEVGLRACYSSLIALYFFLNERSYKLYKLVYSFIIVCGTLFSLLTASKKVLLLLAFGFVYIFVVSVKKKNLFNLLKGLFIAAIFIAVVIYVIYNVEFFEFMKIRFESAINFFINGSGTTSDKERWHFLTEGFGIFLDNIFFGDGTGASYYYFGTYSHSNFIEILMNYGIVGFAVFYSVYPTIVFDCFRGARINTQRTNLSYLSLFMVLSIVYLSIALVYYNILHYQMILAVSVTYVINLKRTRGRHDEYMHSFRCQQP